MVSVGDASQRVKWLGYVGVARWDEENNMGWRRLGIPTAIRIGGPQGDHLDQGGIIRDVLSSGDEIWVSTSLKPEDTK